MATREGAGRTKACTGRPYPASVGLQGVLGTRHSARGSCVAAQGPAASNREVAIAIAGRGEGPDSSAGFSTQCPRCPGMDEITTPFKPCWAFGTLCVSRHAKA